MPIADRYRIFVSGEPGRCDRFRWEIEPPAKSDPRLSSDYRFATRKAAILDARFFLFKDGRRGIVHKTTDDPDHQTSA